MTANSVLPSFPTFKDVDGNPLEAGFIYIGLPNLNPEVAPKQAYFDKELTIPAPQPIRTIGGYPSRNGTPSQIYVDGEFSLTVRDKNGALIYNAATEQLRFSPLISGIYDFRDVSTLLADTGSGFGAGSIWRTRSEGFSYEEAPTSATDHQVTTAGGVKLYVLGALAGFNARAFGVDVSGTPAENGPRLQAALDAAADRVLFIDEAYETTPLHINNSIKIHSAGGGALLSNGDYVFLVNDEIDYLHIDKLGFQFPHANETGGTASTSSARDAVTNITIQSGTAAYTSPTENEINRVKDFSITNCRMTISRVMMRAKHSDDKAYVGRNIWSDFNGVISRPTYLLVWNYTAPVIEHNRFDVPASNNADIVKVSGSSGTSSKVVSNHIRNSNKSQIGQVDTYTGGDRAVFAFNTLVNMNVQRKQGHEGSTAEPPESLSFDKFVYNDFRYDDDLVLPADSFLRAITFRGSRFQAIGNTFEFPENPNALVRFQAIVADSDPTSYGDDFNTRFPQMFMFHHNVCDLHAALVPSGGLSELRFITVATDQNEGPLCSIVGNMMLGDGRFIVSAVGNGRATFTANTWARNPDGLDVVFDGGAEAGNSIGDIGLRAQNESYGQISAGRTSGREIFFEGTDVVIDLNDFGGSSMFLLTSTPGVGGSISDFVPRFRGQTVTFVHDSGSTTPITIKRSTNLRLAGGVDFVMGPRDVLTLTRTYRDQWIEVSRSVNS